MVVVYLIFFFKQKTAYEMRISDWSSDVCSSDLADAGSAPDHVRRNRWAGSCGGSLGKWGRTRVEPVGKRGEGVEVQVRADVFMRTVARFSVDHAAAQHGTSGAKPLHPLWVHHHPHPPPPPTPHLPAPAARERR